MKNNEEKVGMDEVKDGWGKPQPKDKVSDKTSTQKRVR